MRLRCARRASSFGPPARGRVPPTRPVAAQAARGATPEPAPNDDAVFLVQGYDPARIPQICDKVATVRRVVGRVLVAGSRAGIVSLPRHRH